MKNFVLVYRILYAIVILVFLANIVKAIHFDAIPGTTENILLFLSAITNIGLLALVFVFPRRWSTVLSVCCTLWLGFFTWFAWWSSASPFRMHEFHSVDPERNVLKAHQHLLTSGTAFALLCIWFMSLIFLSRSRLGGLRDPTPEKRNA